MVAMNVWPTDASDGAVTSEARWRKMGRAWAPTCVIVGQGGEMKPTYGAPNLWIEAGACWVDGHYCELTAQQVLTVTANGIVVVRFDPAANTAELLYLDGITTPAQSPTGTFEMLVASLSGSVLTDRRMIVDPAKDHYTVNVPAGATTGPYVGSWGGVNDQLQIRAGHGYASTTVYGDLLFSFQTPFPHGIISVQITPVQANLDVFWWPLVANVAVNAVQFFACAPQSYPWATAHPPGQPNVWCIATGGITWDYLAIGV